MAKIRKRFSADIRRLLIIETGNHCAVRHCTHETGLEIHHIDGDPGNNASHNLLMLCAVHHAQATSGTLDKKACTAIKRAIAEGQLKPDSEAINLSSRLELVTSALALLQKPTRTYRAQICGPLFLRPDWYIARRNLAVSLPDYDGALSAYFRSRCKTRTHDVRLILTNRKRFLLKAQNYVSESERPAFVSDILNAIDALWGKNGDRGPDLCCIDTGFINIDMIYDDAAIATYRPAPNRPTIGGTLFRSREYIEAARSKFDNVFDTSSEGQVQELQKLREFVNGLWSR